MCKNVKVTNKGTRTMSSEIFWVCDLNVFHADFDNVFACWTLILVPTCKGNFTLGVIFTLR